MTQPAVWTEAEIDALAPTAKAAVEARKLVAAAAFGAVERSADGTAWAAPCRGSAGTYRVSVRREPRTGRATFACNCPSHQYPCKHALGLMFAVVADPAAHAPAPAPGGDFEALLRAVFRHPDDDTPRLVFADYLDDHGAAERAAFIRLQCRVARLAPRDRSKRDLREEEEGAITRLAHFSRANRVVAPRQPRYERGFLHLSLWLWGATTELPPPVDSLLRDGWVAALELTGGGTVKPDLVNTLALSGAIDCRSLPVDESALLALAGAVTGGARLAGVRLRPADQRLFELFRAAEAGDPAAPGRADRVTRAYRGVTGADVRTLARAGRLTGVRHLTLDGPIGDDGAAALAECSTITPLRTLELRGARIGPAGGAALAASAHLSGVTAVLLTGHAMDDGFAALCDGGGLPGLADFRAEGGLIGDAAADAIGRATHFTRLRRVVWESTALTPAGAAAVLGSAHLPALDEATFDGNPFAPDVCLRLAAEATDRPVLKLVLPGLTVHRRAAKDGIGLEVECTGKWGERAAAEMIDGFARSPAAKRVSALALYTFKFTAAALRTLAAALDPARLRALDFNCHLGNAGAAALAAAFAAFRPTRLTLSPAGVRRAGAEALAASPLTAAVTHLDLSGNDVGPAGVAAFAARAATLKSFNAARTGLTAADRRRLKKQLPALTT